MEDRLNDLQEKAFKTDLKIEDLLDKLENFISEEKIFREETKNNFNKVIEELKDIK